MLSEKNIQFYSIEKSVDGKTFVSIAKVKSNNSINSFNYKFEDPDKIEAPTFYRVKAQADNGKYVYSNIASVSNNFILNSSVTNPFTDHIKLQTTTQQKGILEAQLIDTRGRLIISKKFIINKGLNNSQINGLGGLNAGLYFLRIKFNGKSEEKKLIKTAHSPAG